MKNILIGILGMLMLVGGIAVDDAMAQNYTISGQIIDSRQGIGGIAGVTMTGLPGNPTTGTDGNYSVQVPYGWSGLVKPQKIGYAIFPLSREYAAVTIDVLHQDYNAVLLPKVTLSMNPTTYNLGDPINITMTLQNQGGAFFAPQGFMATNFAVFLQFTDPDGKLITSNFGLARTPPPPPVVPVINPENNEVELLSVDYVESVLANWLLPKGFNVLDYYTLTKGGNYSVQAKFNIRAYLERFETAPGSGVFYAPHDSGSSGDVESNIINFKIISQSTLDHITISPTSSTIVAGGRQAYATRAFDIYNNNTDVTAQTQFTISPNGGCTGSSCTATVLGAHNVMATYKEKTTNASLQVVKYNYTGFLSPVSNTTINTANAGSTIPLKWRITDTHGVGISDRNSFVSFVSSTFDCKTKKATGNPTTEKSGVQYNGDGYWQYNWKTSKNAAGTCWTITINLLDGTTHQATFNLTK